MIIIQSRFQNIFNRVYTASYQLLSYLLVAVVLATFTSQSLESLVFYFYTTLALVALISVWLVIFNTGEGKVVEYGLELNDDSISYIQYGEKTTIKWPDFEGFIVKSRFPRTILLKGSDGKRIEFGYYTFSPEQRNLLFECLAEK